MSVAPALSTPQGLPLWLGRDLVAALPPAASLAGLADLLELHGLEPQRELLPGVWVLRSADGGLATLRAANGLYESGRVLWAHPDFEVPMEKH